MATAAEKLLGITLPSGWTVTKELPRSAAATGGHFSKSYIAEKEGKFAFLKAFDFHAAFRTGVDTIDVLGKMTLAYHYERSLLDHCKERGLSNVVLALDHGHVDVPQFSTMEGRVFFLLFELADGDVRGQMDTTSRFDGYVCMQVLKDVSLGLWQVHKEMIAHQDMKPSNVLCYGDAFKVADFGRSSRKGSPAPHDEFMFPGDFTYAPPEALYGYAHPDFVVRRIGYDFYMLGNLAAFLFSGVNMTPRLFAKLDQTHRPKSWQSTYQNVLPYLNHAFGEVLSELPSGIDECVREEVITTIRELCNPNIDHRGHPKGIGRADQHSLERYVSRFDLWAKRIQVRLKVVRPKR